MQLAAFFNVDIFMFAESPFEEEELVSALKQTSGEPYTCPPHTNQWIQIISRLDPENIVGKYDSVDGRLTIRQVRLKSISILLAVMHFQSQLHWKPSGQHGQATEVRRNIGRIQISNATPGVTGLE